MISEDKVREVLKPFEYVKGVKIRPASVEILSGMTEYVIYLDRITTTCNGEIKTYGVGEYCDDRAWSPDWRKAFQRIHNLITQPEQSLEEKVREILKPLEGVNDIEVSEDSFSFSDADGHRRVVTRDSVEVSTKNHSTTYPHSIYLNSFDGGLSPGSVTCKLIRLMQSLSLQTETELEERVRELKKLVDKTNDNAKHWNKEWIALDGKCKKLQDQLDNAISNADHEAEMQKYESAFEEVTQQRDEARKEAERFKQAFFREYFSNQPAIDFDANPVWP